MSSPARLELQCKIETADDCLQTHLANGSGLPGREDVLRLQFEITISVPLVAVWLAPTATTTS